MTKIMFQKYNRPKVSNGDLNVPIKFYRTVTDDGPYPTVSEKEVFMTLADVYESSIKDLERLKGTDSKHIISLNFRNPRKDYQVDSSDVFEILDEMYEGIKFNIEHFSLTGESNDLMKIVGVAYAN